MRLSLSPSYSAHVPIHLPTFVAATSLDKAACCAAAVTIADARPGQIGHVCHTHLEEEDAAILRAMGLRPQARVRVCRVGEPCIVEVIAGSGCACRIGLSLPLARLVLLADVCAA